MPDRPVRLSTDDLVAMSPDERFTAARDRIVQPGSVPDYLMAYVNGVVSSVAGLPPAPPDVKAAAAMTDEERADLLTTPPPAPHGSGEVAKLLASREVCADPPFVAGIYEVLPKRRGGGMPSATDWTRFDGHPLVQLLATEYEGWTLDTDDPLVRVVVSHGAVMPYVLFTRLTPDNAVELLRLDLIDDFG